jgi:beta-N-acetylhexosaminidase
MTTKGVSDAAEKLGGLKPFFDRYPIGGIFVGGEVIKDRDQAAAETRRIIDSLQDASPSPLIVMGDFEWGVGQNVFGMTKMTSIMGLSAADSPELAYEYGAAIGAEVRQLGGHVSYSPVADINFNPFNQVTNVRSAGDDPDHVIRILKPLVRGMQDRGVSATAKHFPGDGFDFRNQHFVTSENPLSVETWNNYSGKVFQALIDEGLHMIMAGHIAFPAYQKERILGLAPPGTLSRELLTDLLKGEMGFPGLIVSDALMMGGFLAWYEDRRETELQCLAAGCDMLLWPLPETLDYIEQEAEKGRVPMERIDDAVTRIDRLKQFHGLIPGGEEQPREPGTIRSGFPMELAEKSLQLEWDRSGLLPISPENKKILLVIASAGNENRDELKTMAGLLEERGAAVDVKDTFGINTLKDFHDQYDLILFCFCTLGLSFIDPAVNGNSLGAVWESLCYGREKTIVISFGSPYIHEQYFPLAPVGINAWGQAESVRKAVVKALCGEIEFQGKRPVKKTVQGSRDLYKLLT